MGRKSQHSLPPGIQLDQHGVYWATLEGDDAKLWRERYPGRSLPRRKAPDLKAALKLQRSLTDDLRANRDPNANNPKIADWVQTCIDRKRKLAPSTIASPLSTRSFDDPLWPASGRSVRPTLERYRPGAARVTGCWPDSPAAARSGQDQTRAPRDPALCGKCARAEVA